MVVKCWLAKLETPHVVNTQPPFCLNTSGPDFSQTSKHGRELVTGPVATHEPYLPASVAWDTVSQQSPGGWGVQESFASPMERDRLLACTSSRRRLLTQL